jgi:uncharacterized integral membrane protein
LTEPAHSAGSTLRKVVAAVILIPLAVLIIAFAVANRQAVTVSFDPFNPDVPAASVTKPLFVVILAVLIFGVIVGGVAAWLRQTKWRRTARRLEREVASLKAENDVLKRNGAPPGVPSAAMSAERLQLRPPIR